MHITKVLIALYIVETIASFWFPKTDVQSFCIIGVFTSLGIGFLTVGILMIYSLKTYFTEFYNKVRCVLWAATLMLSIPMFLRASNWILQEMSPKYYRVYYDNIAIANACYALITTIVPVVAQMASLIFGAYRRHKIEGTARTSSANDHKYVR